MAKKFSRTKLSIRQYKNKDGAIRKTVVKSHSNKINRKPRKK
jgi:hypothetical protein